MFDKNIKALYALHVEVEAILKKYEPQPNSPDSFW
jgi:hypothetical protein